MNVVPTPRTKALAARAREQASKMGADTYAIALGVVLACHTDQVAALVALILDPRTGVNYTAPSSVPDCCLSCERSFDEVTHRSRGLCRTCYDRHAGSKTLHRYPALTRRGRQAAS